MKQINPYGGVIACGEWDREGNYYYAEIEPSYGAWYKQFLPSVQRWWFEVHEQQAKFDKNSPDQGAVTHAYTDYGSGGAWTFRGCVIKARRAVEIASETADKDTK